MRPWRVGRRILQLGPTTSGKAATTIRANTHRAVGTRRLLSGDASSHIGHTSAGRPAPLDVENERGTTLLFLNSLLEPYYAECSQPTPQECMHLAERYNLDVATVIQWFLKRALRTRPKATSPLTPAERGYILQSLEPHYKQCPKPTRRQRAELASQYDITVDQVDRWFKNRRYRDNRIDSATPTQHPPDPPMKVTRKPPHILEKHFLACPLPTREQLEELARMYSLTYTQVYTWYARRRVKEGVVDPSSLKPASLEKYYQLAPFPSAEIRTQLAARFKMSERQITTWFDKRGERDRGKRKPFLKGIQDKSHPLDPLLEKHYQVHEHLTDSQVRELASQYNLSRPRVRDWFRRRRLRAVADIQSIERGGSRPISTLDLAKVIPSDLQDLSGITQYTIQIEHGSKISKVRIEYDLDDACNLVAFPSGTMGYFYYATEPGAPEFLGRIRFKLASTHMTLNEIQEEPDLLRSDGLPWNIPIGMLRIQQSAIVEKLVQDGNISRELALKAYKVYQLKPLIGPGVPVVYGEQEFSVRLDAHSTVVWAISETHKTRFYLKTDFLKNLKINIDMDQLATTTESSTTGCAHASIGIHPVYKSLAVIVKKVQRAAGLPAIPLPRPEFTLLSLIDGAVQKRFPIDSDEPTANHIEVSAS